MVADTYSTDGIGVLLMGTGNDPNAWGANANSAVFQILVDAIANSLTSAVTGGTLDLSGSPPPAASSQSRYAGLIFNGVLGSNQLVQVPNLAKWWLVQNNTSGAFTLKFKTSSGSASTAIPQNGGWQVVYCDGANNIVVWPFNTKQIQMPDGTVGAPPFSNVTETNSGWYRAGTQDWRFAINGVDVIQVTGTGASSPSIFDIKSPLSVQAAGAQIIPPGTEFDYAGIELPSGGYLWEDGTAYSRSTYAALFAAITKACTGNTHTSTTIDNLSVDLRGKGLIGALVEGTGISTGTAITALTASSMTISPAASSSNTGISLRILPWGQGDASTTFNVPDRRDLVTAGRGDMNVTSDRNLLTVAGGVKGTQLNQGNTVGGGFAGLDRITLVLSQMASKVVSFFYNTVSISFQPGATPANPVNVIQLTNPGGYAEVDLNVGGSDGAHNNVQPTGITNKIIKT